MARIKVLETILVLVLALMVFYRITNSPYIFLLAVIVGVIGLFIPSLAEKIHFAWMKLAELLGFVTSKIILTIIFFILLVPLSVLFRAFGKNAVQRKAGSNSCFKERNFTYTPESLENVW
jgi:saxitoxin biosynthesis operon SxtJ-like protein